MCQRLLGISRRQPNWLRRKSVSNGAPTTTLSCRPIVPWVFFLYRVAGTAVRNVSDLVNLPSLGIGPPCLQILILHSLWKASKGLIRPFYTQLLCVTGFRIWSFPVCDWKLSFTPSTGPRPAPLPQSQASTVPSPFSAVCLDNFQSQSARFRFQECQSQYQPLENGTPQGGVLSPTLSNALMNGKTLYTDETKAGKNPVQ